LKTDDKLEIEIWYGCPICGITSKNEERIRKCMAKGRKNIYEEGKEVEFLFNGMQKFNGHRVWARGLIKSIKFNKVNHRPSYRIVSNDKRIPSNLHGYQFVIPESHVRHILPETK
jgi:hypothetical protein